MRERRRTIVQAPLRRPPSGRLDAIRPLLAGAQAMFPDCVEPSQPD
jgi:hypothetical protein